MSNHKVTVKRSISPVTLTVKVVATRINENGTFSGFTSIEGTGPNGTFKVSAPPQGGGSLYLKVETLENVKVLPEAATNSPTVKAKLF
jgi:hypothetical protein